jgi:hypothetical protein
MMFITIYILIGVFLYFVVKQSDDKFKMSEFVLFVPFWPVLIIMLFLLYIRK